MLMTLPRAPLEHVRADGARAEHRLGQIDVHDELQFVVGDAALPALPGSATSGLRMESPSAFTRTSMRPNVASTESTARRTSSASSRRR